MSKTIGVATRPIFIPNKNQIGVIEKNITFDWHMGMSKQVRQRSIASLHEKATALGFSRILEASSKTEYELGRQLSAFFLKNEADIPVENLFQSSKYFEKGGPFLDLQNRTVTPREAKKDQRLKSSGQFLGFFFDNKEYPTEPKSIFYDWLYIKTLEEPHNINKKEGLLNTNFDAFSDIEFNPEKSFSCQARTLALYVSLFNNESVREFLQNPEKTSTKYQLYQSNYSTSKVQQSLF